MSNVRGTKLSADWPFTARGDHRQALVEADAIYATRDRGAPWAYVSEALVEGIESALEVGDLEDTERRLGELDALDRSRLLPVLQAQSVRLRGRLAAANGEDPGPRLTAAAAHLRELGLPFHLAVTQLEHSEWLAAHGRATEAAQLIAEARDTFVSLRAEPWIARADAVAAPTPVPASTASR